MDQDLPTNRAFHLLGWLAEHAEEFEPPVSNKVLWKGSDFIAMVVRGPNARSDFHIDPGDEIFLQLKGAIRVDTLVDGIRHQRIVGEGEIMLVPGMVPHAPMRPEGSWGLVIERPRVPGELDVLRWYCDECGDMVHEVSFPLSDIEVQLAAALEDFNTSEALRTCPSCGHLAAVPGPFTADGLIER